MPAAPPRSPRPGWYADPRGSEEFRWWDGEAWTAWLADSAYAPGPQGEVSRVVPAPVFAEPRGIRGFVIGLTVAVVALVLAAVSLVGQGLPQPSEPYLEARPSDLGTPTRVYRAYEVVDGAGVVMERLVLPVPPRAVRDYDTETLPGVLRSATLATRSVAAEWGVNCVLGDAEPDLVVAGDARATAERVLPALLRRYQVGVAYDVVGTRVEPLAARPDLPGAVRLTAVLRYESELAGSAGDDVVMVVIPWTHGDQSGMGVWALIIPQITPREVSDELRSAESAIRWVT